jgi:hypothetical protein
MNDKRTTTSFSRRRATLRKLMTAGAIGTAGMTALLRAALAANPAQGFRKISGTVTVDGKPARPGQIIRPGQRVETGPDSEAVYVVGKDAFLQHENSAFEIDRRPAVVVLRYITGKVLSVFGKGRKRLETPTATIGIRGTGCYIEAEAERTYFCLCYGVAVVEPHADRVQRETVRTKHHEYPLYIGATPGSTMMAKTAVINHTDDELIMLEQLVGRLPPFYGKDYDPYK